MPSRSCLTSSGGGVPTAGSSGASSGRSPTEGSSGVSSRVDGPGESASFLLSPGHFSDFQAPPWELPSQS